MSKRKRRVRRHTGRTGGGNTRDKKVERLGRVTIYQRGLTYYLYYRQDSITQRHRVDGNLATARATASQVNAALEEQRPSPLGFLRIGTGELIRRYLESCEHTRALAPRTLARYGAALAHLRDFAGTRPDLKTADHFTPSVVEDFVGYLRSQTRTRNGAKAGKQRPFRTSGIRFILSTCRTAFSFALKHRYLPPYAGNPFSELPIDAMGDRHDTHGPLLTAKELDALLEACTAWQYPLFAVLAGTGMRTGELVHLLIEDVDLDSDVVHIRSKPELMWWIKTGRQRDLPLTLALRQVFAEAIGDRTAGFVFLNEPHASGQRQPAKRFASPLSLRRHLVELAEAARAELDVSEKDVERCVRTFVRALGQIPEKRVRAEFMKLTAKIGRPEVTRAHSLRHVFTTRAQEMGMNPLMVQQLLGHSTLSMTARYTHLDVNSMREALSQMQLHTNDKSGTEQGLTETHSEVGDDHDSAFRATA
jgi:integrase